MAAKPLIKQGLTKPILAGLPCLVEKCQINVSELSSHLAHCIDDICNVTLNRCSSLFLIKMAMPDVNVFRHSSIAAKETYGKYS